MTRFEQSVRCWMRSSGAGLQAGADVVIEPADLHGRNLPDGVVVDELIGAEDYAAITDDAIVRRRRWREARRDALTVDGVDLTWVWELELLAEVFLPELRAVEGLRRALAGSAARRVELIGADAELQAAVSAVLEAEVSAREPADPPSYPSRTAVPQQSGKAPSVRHRLVRGAGVPAWTRGNVVAIPYWHLVPLYDALAGDGDLRLVYDPFRVPPLAGARLARALVRGGWVGRPGARAVARSRSALARALAAARSTAPADPLDRFLDQRALRMLEHRAQDTLALVAAYRRAAQRRAIRAAVLPFDSPPDARAVIAGFRSARKPVLVIQHGFASDPNDPDKTEADVVGVWNDHDRDALAPRARGALHVTGNPGARAPAAATARDAVTLVLPEYPSRLSLRFGARVTAQSIAIALRALAAARPGSRVVIRPHPVDFEAGTHRALAAGFPELTVTVDTVSPIEQLIGAADLCVAGISTAALQSGAAGVRVAHLQLAAPASPWPLDGRSGIPVARDADELADAIRTALDNEPPIEVCRSALGVRGDALERALELVRSTAKVPA